jgi:hypothetical protein
MRLEHRVRYLSILSSKHLVGNDLWVVPTGVFRRPRRAITIRFGSENRVPCLDWPYLERTLLLALLGLWGGAVVIFLIIVVAIVIQLGINLLIKVDKVLRATVAHLSSLFFGTTVRISVIVSEKAIRLVLLATPLYQTDLVHDLATR